MNYDEELHSAWVQQALQLAMDYREAEPGSEVRDAMRAMKTHFEGRPASMDAADAMDKVAPVVRAAGEELTSMRRCFEAADRERSELRDRAERAEAENRALRRLLAVRVSGASLYTDDGGLEDNSKPPFIDYYLDSPAVIHRKLQERALAKPERDALRADAERYRYVLKHARRIDICGLSMSKTSMFQLSARIDAEMKPK